jgi:isoleucyl-tRNA synthetase
MFTPQSSKPDFTAIFESVHSYRSDNHIFQASVDKNPSDNQFRFYDGPPFVTGLPHYGHLASSVAKDVIPRFQTMKGKKVERVRGRDCHGIPIEQKVQTKLGLSSNLDIEKVGIETFINGCYDYTRSVSGERKWYIDQFARWVDFDHSYKTMDNNYMESVRRVFKTLWDKWLIYKWKRVSLYSTKLETPISNFEVAMDDTYEDVNDPAITVMLDLSINGSEYDNTFALIWTTTPWTIPVNIAAGVHKDISYSKVLYNNSYYIVATNRAEAVFANKEYEIVDTFLWEQLVGLSYKPPYDYLYGKTNNDKDHKIYHADFVSDTDGTGLVHEAPEFGEVDFQLAKQVGLTITEAMDSSGHYTSLMEDKSGVFYRDANPVIIQELHDMGRLFHKASITHRVAFCPRSGTPLVYKAQDSWFIDINGPQEIFWGKSLKQKCIEANEGINRYPEHNKHGRFLKSLESAPDRCISRTRYWGTPIPIYRSTDGNNIIVIWSREELYELQLNGSNNIIKKQENGKTIYRNITRNAELDLHRPFIDDVWFEKDGIRYERISEVLDCWVESASMPYAQVHYPFENKEKFENSFPADYIVEYTGQIRAWFYVMHVLGVALFDKPAFKNVICHGVIAGNDGRKMSKSLGNFPDPKPTFAQYGGDAVRMSILTTPLFNWWDMNFSEDLILEALKQNILPLWNAFSFFVTYANIDKRESTSREETAYTAASSTNRLDTWILGELATATQSIDTDLSGYDITHASRQIASFLENLTNWYIRRSRRRFWKSDSDEDKASAYATLYTVLTQFCIIATPFMPIVTEYIWKVLTGKDINNSVHLQDYPSVIPATAGISSSWDPRIREDDNLSEDMQYAQTIVRMWLASRGKKNIRVRQPLSTLILGVHLDQYYLDIIAEELNIKQVICDPALNSHVTKICKPDGKIIGQLFWWATKEIFALAKSGEFIESEDGSIAVGEWLLPAGSYEISYIKTDESEDIEVDNGIVMKIDWNITPELEREWYARDLIRAIQDARKEADYDIADRILLKLEGGSFAEDIINHHGATIQEETLSTISYTIDQEDIAKSLALGSKTITFSLQK